MHLLVKTVSLKKLPDGEEAMDDTAYGTNSEMMEGRVEKGQWRGGGRFSLRRQVLNVNVRVVFP